MRIFFGFVFFLCVFFASGQSKTKKKKEVEPQWTAQQVLQSDDPVKMATFIRANPTHERVSDIKSRILQLLSSQRKEGGKSVISNKKQVVKENLNPTKKRVLSTGTSSDAEETARMLNHLFTDNSNAKEAYLQITNVSDCPLEVTLSNRYKTYTVFIAPKSNGHTMIEKGQYYLSTIICTVKFSSNHTIDRDMIIQLGNKK